MNIELTKHGFKWGFLEVERTASNDGTDKRKKFNVLTIKHPSGKRLQVLATKEDLKAIPICYKTEESQS